MGWVNAPAPTGRLWRPATRGSGAAKGGDIENWNELRRRSPNISSEDCAATAVSGGVEPVTATIDTTATSEPAMPGAVGKPHLISV